MLDILIASPRTLCHEYRAVLAQARSLGYTLPTPGQQRRQNRLLLELQWNGIWSKLDVFYAFANNGSKEFATLDWVTPSTHQITLVNSPTWAANQGYTGDGATSYLDTNYNPSTMGVQYTQDNAGRFHWIHTGVASSVLEGISSSLANRALQASSGAQRINQGTASLSSNADLSGTGLKAIYRTSSTNVEVFNGVTQTSRTATSAAITSANQLLMRSSSNYGNSTHSIYGMGSSLVAQNTALNDILSTYMAAL